MLVNRETKSRAQNEQKDRRRDQLRLPLECKKCPRHETGAPCPPWRVGDCLHHILVGEKRIARYAELGEQALDLGLVGARIGIDLRSGGLIEDAFDKTRAPGIGVVESSFFGLEFAPGHIEPLQGFARGGPRIARGARRFCRESWKRPGKARMKRAGKSRGRMALDMDGIDPKSDDFADSGRSRSGRAGA